VPFPVWTASILLFHITYIAFSYRELMNLRGVGGYLKAFAYSFIGVLCWSIFSTTIGLLYLVFG
jgi:hypothetical protein